MASFANNQFDKELGEFVRAGSRVDVLSPANLAYSYPSMSEEDLEWSRRLLEPANASWLLHRGTLPCSIILLDEEAVTISPTYTGVSGDTFGVLFSTNPDVTRWATDFFEGHMSNDLVRAGQWPRMVQMTQASEYIEPLNSEG